jgi:nucleoside-diphosphate-sugar epimerase
MGFTGIAPNSWAASSRWARRLVATTAAAWFGQEANLRFVSWEEWRAGRPEEEVTATWDHIAHSPNCSIAKAQQLLNYQPRYSSFQAVYEAVNWLIEQGTVQIE